MTETRPAGAPDGARPPLPRAVLLLALTIFCLGTSEFMIAGLLPSIADDLRVSVPAVGGLISIFAIGMLVGAPVMTLLTLGLPRRLTLLLSTLVFAAAHLVVLISDAYPLLVVSRLVGAVACATFWAVAAATAVAITDSRSTAKAMAVLVGGLTIANVIGVPGGTWIGEHWGWRATFVVVGVLTVVTGFIGWRTVPETSQHTGEKLGRLAGRELRALRNPRLLVALATTAAFQAAIFCTFSYLAPLLSEVSGVPEQLIPVVLLVFGAGTLMGIAVGGRYADRNLLRAVVVCFVLLLGGLVLLRAAAGSPVLVWFAVFVFGATGFSVASAINARVFSHAGAAPTLASAMNVSAFNVGNAVGPALGGWVIAAGAGLTAPIWVSMVLVALALSLAGTSWLLERPSPAAAPVRVSATKVNCDTAS